MFSPMFAVERAHRVPSRPPHPGEPPRPFLFKFLNFKDRDSALYQARTRGDAMKVDNVCISFYPDFSADLQHKRAKFTEVKKRLRRFDVSYVMLYPARLRVAATLFVNPNVASEWLNCVEHTLKPVLHGHPLLCFPQATSGTESLSFFTVLFYLFFLMIQSRCSGFTTEQLEQCAH